MTGPPDISTALAEHVAGVGFDDLPAEVVEITKLSILDGIGVILAASGLAPECRPFVEMSSDGPPEATILGFGRRTDMAAAAFANGAMSHALDYEDAHVVAPVHANAAALPAALALAEGARLSGRTLLVAVAVGCDVASRLGLSVGGAVARRGWYPPPILSTQGAAAAAASALGLGVQGTLDAMALSACQVAPSFEIVNGERSVLRSVREAFCARAGLVSARLARDGVAGGPRPLDGEHGLLTMFAGADWDAEALLDGLGVRFEGLRTSFKLWPSCRGTHAFVEGALRLLEQHPVPPDRIERVSVTGGPIARMLIEPLERKRAPSTAIDAKFSIPFTVASAIVHGGIGLDSFEPERLADADVLALAARVHCTVEAARPDSSAVVAIRERDGHERHLVVDDVPGDPGRPLPREAIEHKFAQCAARAAVPLDAEAIAAVIDTVRRLDAVDDAGGALGAALRGA